MVMPLAINALFIRKKFPLSQFGTINCIFTVHQNVSFQYEFVEAVFNSDFKALFFPVPKFIVYVIKVGLLTLPVILGTALAKSSSRLLKSKQKSRLVRKL
jgi:hypothetical protein